MIYPKVYAKQLNFWLGECFPLFFVIFLFFFSSNVIAAPPHSQPKSKTVSITPNKIWTLAALTNLALIDNPSTRLAWAQVQAAVANEGIAKSTYWPQLVLTGSTAYTTNNDNNDDNNDGNDDFGCSSDDPYCASLTLNYLVWDFGARKQQVKNAHYQFIASQLSQNETIQLVILQVEQAYYQVLAQDALVKANQTSVKEAKTNLDAANALHHQGLATIGDVYQAQSTLAQSLLALQQAQGNLSIARGQLASAIGIPVQTPLKVAPLSTDAPTTQILYDVRRFLDKAKNQRPDLLAAEAQITAAQAQVKATQAQRWPTLTFSAQTENSNFQNTLNEVDRQSNLMLTLNWPVFTGFQRTNAIKQAQAEEQEAQATRDQLANQINLQVWQAYYSLKTAKNTIDTSRVYLKTSVEAAKQTLGQYKAGVGNILSVLTTQTTEANARVQLIQSVLDWYLDLAQLMQAIGALEVPSQ